MGSIPDWDKFFAQAYRCCRPDGWVESFEPSPFFTSDDGTVNEESALGQWGKFFIEGGKKFGMNFTIVEDDVQVKAMEAAGFVDIQAFEYKVSEYPFLLASRNLTRRYRLDSRWRLA